MQNLLFFMSPCDLIGSTTPSTGTFQLSFSNFVQLSSSIAHVVLISDFDAAARQIHDIEGEVCHG